ncbi:MAG: hypothetical protein AAF456_20180 [Planctomycetota bacterium]
MQIYRFWTRATGSASGRNGIIQTECLGYSNSSLEDALRVAQQRAGDVARRIAAGESIDAGYYPGSPIREELVEEFSDESSGGQTLAAITRNSYGCLVLNTPSVFFADVDQENNAAGRSGGGQGSDGGGIFGALKGLFGQSDALDGLKEVMDQVQDTVEAFSGQPEGTDLAGTLKQIVASDSSLRLRLYRTMMGFRVLVTSRLIPATSPEARDLLVRMGADRLYASLCRTQDCYRARLTPKAWRIGFKKPSVRFPFDAADSRQRMDQWLADYEPHAAGYSTCHLVGEFGDAPVHPAADRVAQLHDHYTLNGQLPLA